MNTNYVYDIFETTQRNDAPDLTIGLAMLRAKQPIPDEEAKTIREFMGRHYGELVEAFKSRDREGFNTVVAELTAQDQDEQPACQDGVCEIPGV